MRTVHVIGVVSFSIIAGSSLWAGEKRQHKPHEHGHGKLNVVIDQGAVSIELDAPMDDIIGFEHKPRNDKEKKALDEAIATLKSAEKCFALPAEASCAVKSSEAGMEAEAKGHADLNAKWEFTCANASALKSIDVLMFKEFKRMKELDVQIAGAQGQKSQELTPKNAKLTL